MAKDKLRQGMGDLKNFYFLWGFMVSFKKYVANGRMQLHLLFLSRQNKTKCFFCFQNRTQVADHLLLSLPYLGQSRCYCSCQMEMNSL
jgi:hypothetical protein